MLIIACQQCWYGNRHYNYIISCYNTNKRLNMLWIGYLWSLVLGAYKYSFKLSVSWSLIKWKCCSHLILIYTNHVVLLFIGGWMTDDWPAMEIIYDFYWFFKWRMRCVLRVSLWRAAVYFINHVPSLAKLIHIELFLFRKIGLLLAMMVYAMSRSRPALAPGNNWLTKPLFMFLSTRSN